MQCSATQCSAVVYQICERIPHTLLTQVYQLDGDGIEKLEKVFDMVTKAKTKAEERVTGMINHPPCITTAPSEANITQDASRHQQNTPDSNLVETESNADLTSTTHQPTKDTALDTTLPTPRAPQDAYRKWPPAPIMGEGSTGFKSDTKNRTSAEERAADKGDYPLNIAIMPSEVIIA